MPEWQRIVGLGPHATDAKFLSGFNLSAEGAAAAQTATSGYGHHALASGVMPSFTNPNNVSIMTGVTPAVHGIVGNYYFDAATKQEVMMTDPKLLRAQSLFQAMHAAGVKVRHSTAQHSVQSLLSFQFSVK
jgi:phosphonoacetate hydrolase